MNSTNAYTFRQLKVHLIMKRRLLYAFFPLLILFSSYAGISAQKAVFSASDEIEIVTIHSASKDFVLSSANESSGAERVFSRSQKRTEFSNCFFKSPFVKVAALEVPSVFLSSNISKSTFRVLLLPKLIQNIIFLQTVI